MVRPQSPPRARGWKLGTVNHRGAAGGAESPIAFILPRWLNMGIPLHGMIWTIFRGSVVDLWSQGVGWC